MFIESKAPCIRIIAGVTLYPGNNVVSEVQAAALTQYPDFIKGLEQGIFKQQGTQKAPEAAQIPEQPDPNTGAVDIVAEINKLTVKNAIAMIGSILFVTDLERIATEAQYKGVRDAAARKLEEMKTEDGNANAPAMPNPYGVEKHENMQAQIDKFVKKSDT